MSVLPPERQWIDKADEDLDAARRLLGPPRPLTWVACFHAQQCAEKYLKGYLVSQRADFRYVHDLVYLTQLCLELKPAFVELLKTARILMQYGTEIRYPTEQYKEPHEDEAWEAIRLAESVAAFVKSHL